MTHRHKTPPSDGANAGFHPAGASVPEGVRTARLLLRPLRATDVELDYDAVMSSAPELRRWSASDWPRDGFTLAENLADLERHEREHLAGVAFTHTVLAPGETRCLGCVYVRPIWHEAAPLCVGARRAAAVGFWVRTSEIVGGLDRHLLATLIEWFEHAWSFDCVLFTNAATETRQADLFSGAGLSRHPLVWPDGEKGSAFRPVRGRTTSS